MKKLFFVLSLMIATATFAQTEKYYAAMGSALKQLGEAKTGEEMIAVEQKFERIANAEKNQWLPYYYASMMKARMSMMGVGGDKDVVADEATNLIDIADSLSKNNCEIYCVKAMIATAKMIVNPQARFMEYGMKITTYLEQAKKMDATNPRPFVLQSSNLKNTPEQFGGGCKTANPLAQKALSLFATFKPQSELHPNWGKELVEAVVNDCK